ncbi:MAG: hypothetical protein IT169_15930 [Bryobacterales bacterium]|nr:hypothetical protein [Bryobacterales bacterium]
MRPSDKRIFLEAAAHFQFWILVRRTNPASLPYIGLPGYSPKRIDCKAKTADLDRPPYKLAGLVVDPRIHPRAFNAGKEDKAMAAWKSMEPMIGQAYKTDADPKSKHYGCLRLDGNYIHGDYDLYDIIDITQAHRNLAAVETLHGQPHRRGANLLPVQRYINDRIGSPMVQHGGEAQYADHSQQAIDAFGPNGEDVTIPNEFSVRGWYSQRFGGRRALGR